VVAGHGDRGKPAMPVCTQCNAAILSVENYSQQNSLSTRQAEVLALLCEGLANKEIARALGISACTVKLHVQGVLQKLGAANRVQAVVFAYRNSYVGGRAVERKGEAAERAAFSSCRLPAFAPAN
jgi:ATP/maltotriose-dependent transcriptional regulator MalT